jgi:hypothetical protein
MGTGRLLDLVKAAGGREFETLRAVADGQTREIDSTELTLLQSGVSIHTAPHRRRQPHVT